MKKLLRTSLCMIALLSLEQAHAKSKETKETATQEAENKDSWAYRNRYKIAGGAALGAGAAAAYLYQNEIADFIKSLTPQQAAQQAAALEGSIAADLKDVTKKEAMVDAKEHKSEESVADMQADIAQKQDAIAKKQTMLESFYEYLTSKERLQEINPENKPVDSWGFYKSTPNSKLTPEEEAEWQKQNAYDRAQDENNNPKTDTKEAEYQPHSLLKQLIPGSYVDEHEIFHGTIGHRDNNGYHPAQTPAASDNELKSAQDNALFHKQGFNKENSPQLFNESKSNNAYRTPYSNLIYEQD